VKPTSEGKRHGSNRDRRYDEHKTEEDSVAFRALAACFHESDGNKAVGIDGVSIDPEQRKWFCPEPIARIGHDGF
jgi:kynurenine formamidase